MQVTNRKEPPDKPDAAANSVVPTGVTTFFMMRTTMVVTMFVMMFVFVHRYKNMTGKNASLYYT